MHINSESVLVEIVDRSGHPVSAGERGRVLVTDLLNTSMPFIRYETGDRAVMSYEPCACGLRTPRLWLEGRYSAYLSFGRRRIHHLEFDGALDGFMNIIIQYQVAKTAEDSILVRIVPGISFQVADIDRIKANVQAIAGEGISVAVVSVGNIERTVRGKSRIVIDETLQKKQPANESPAV